MIGTRYRIGNRISSTDPARQLLAGGRGVERRQGHAEPITDDYPGTSPYAFTGGTITEAIVDVSGEPFIDLEKEAVAMMARE